MSFPRCIESKAFRKSMNVIIAGSCFDLISLELISEQWLFFLFESRFGFYVEEVFFFSFFFLFVLDVPHLTNEHRTQDCIAS